MCTVKPTMIDGPRRHYALPFILGSYLCLLQHSGRYLSLIKKWENMHTKAPSFCFVLFLDNLALICRCCAVVVICMSRAVVGLGSTRHNCGEASYHII